MGYYGITYCANNLSGNIYVNYELVMSVLWLFLIRSYYYYDLLLSFNKFELMDLNFRLIEFPAYISGMYATDKFGRRPTVGIGFIVSGLACLTTGLVPQG